MSLPPQVTAFYCTRAFAREHPQLIGMLDEKKISIRLDTTDGLNSDCLVAVGLLDRYYQKAHYKEILSCGVKTVFYASPTEDIGFHPVEGEFALFTSEHQLFLTAQNAKYTLDEQGKPEVGITARGGQGAAIGMWRETSILADREKERSYLRDKLAEASGCHFIEGLPLMFYAETYHHDPEPLNRALLRLSKRANIFVKDLNFEIHMYQHPMTALPKADTIFVYGKSQTLNYLARYAADATLSVAFGGFLITSIMVGARTIPIYTQKIYPWLAAYNARRQISFTSHLRSPLMALPARVMDYLTPLSIENTDAIIDRMNDEDYWQRYDAMLPEIQSYVLGNFTFDEAAYNRARGFIIRFLQGGSFAPAGYSNGKLSVLTGIPGVPSSPPL